MVGPIGSGVLFACVEKVLHAFKGFFVGLLKHCCSVRRSLILAGSIGNNVKCSEASIACRSARPRTMSAMYSAVSLGTFAMEYSRFDGNFRWGWGTA